MLSWIIFAVGIIVYAKHASGDDARREKRYQDELRAERTERHLKLVRKHHPH